MASLFNALKVFTENSYLNLCLLLAPPAFGKTSILLELFQKVNTKFIFVSPLRTLANEFEQRANCVIPTYNLKGRKNGFEILRAFSSKPRALLIMTPESLSSLDYEIYFTGNELFILDEFHLFTEWGESFRFYLLEFYFYLLGTQKKVLGLSATCSASLMQSLQEERGLILNLGNMQFKNYPQRFHWIPSVMNNLWVRIFERELRQKKGTILYFCAFREEVERLHQKALKKGYKSIACKGGETEYFSQNIMKQDYHIIFSTSALSHGVNLPQVRLVFISYQVQQQGMWIQMAARGGRCGEHFDVYSRESYFVNRRKSFWQLFIDSCQFFVDWPNLFPI